jgi:hypothetical protein
VIFAILLKPTSLPILADHEIFWFSNLLTVSVYDEGYSKQPSCAIFAILLKPTSLPILADHEIFWFSNLLTVSVYDEGYSKHLNR